jgi:hypothetical protein
MISKVRHRDGQIRVTRIPPTFPAMARLVGRDIRAAVGLRVNLTAEGHEWEINKSGRGDLSGNQPGTVVDIAENGLICCVKWDASGVIQRYPAGVMNRFYLSGIDDQAPVAVTEVPAAIVPQNNSDSLGGSAPPVHRPVDPTETKKAKKISSADKAANQAEGNKMKEDTSSKSKDRKKIKSKGESKASSSTGIEASNSSIAPESPSVSSVRKAVQGPEDVNSQNGDPASPHVPQIKGDPNTVPCRLLFGGRWRQVCPHPDQATALNLSS